MRQDVSFFFFSLFLQMQLIKSMLSPNPGDRPEASALYRRLKKLKRLIREKNKAPVKSQSQ